MNIVAGLVTAFVYQTEVDQVRALLEGLAHQLQAAQHDLTLAAEQYRGELMQAQELCYTGGSPSGRSMRITGLDEHGFGPRQRA